MSGLSITFPVLWLISLIPGLAPICRTLSVGAECTAALYLQPGMLALNALAIYPVIEEVLYRGFVLQLFRRYSPGWVAVLGSTLFFAVTHIGGGLQNVIFALATGLVLSWLVLRTESLYPSILCHATVNLASLFVFDPLFAAHGYFNPGEFCHVMPIALLVTSFGLVPTAMGVLRRETAPVGGAFGF
jgi:membrane protease YdiL (CAAX protease family)